MELDGVGCQKTAKTPQMSDILGMLEKNDEGLHYAPVKILRIHPMRHLVKLMEGCLNGVPNVPRLLGSAVRGSRGVTMCMVEVAKNSPITHQSVHMFRLVEDGRGVL